MLQIRKKPCLARLAVSLRLPLATLIALFWLAIPAIADQPVEYPSSDTGVTVIADSRARDTLYGASVRLDLGTISMNQLENLKVGFGSVDNVIGDPNKPVTVQVLMPADLETELQDNFVKEITTRLSRNFDAKSFVVKPVLIDITAAEKAEKLSSAEIDLVQQSLASATAEDKAIAGEMIAQNRNLLRLLKDWSSSFRNKIREIIADYDRKSMAFASMMGMVSSISPTYVFLTTTGVNPFGISQVAMAIAYDQLNTTYAAKLLEFENEHKLPFGRNHSIVRFYNRNTFVKALTVNLAINAVAAGGFRLLAWLQAPERIASPMSMEFLASLGGMTAIGAAFTGGGDVGLRQLRRKGYISGFTEIVICSAFNFLNQINNLMLGTGRTEFLPIGLGLEWTGKSIAFLAGKLLPTKSNRFVIIHPAMSSESAEQARKIFDLNESIKLDDMNTDRFRESFEKLETKETEQVKSYKAMFIEAVQKIQKLVREMYYHSCKYLEGLFRQILPN
jgi:hypothetical protein